MKRGIHAACAAMLLAAVGAVIAPSDAHAIGLLIPKDVDVRPFDVESHRVDVTITNTAAVTKIEQVFRNHTDRPMEATFIFPIPEGATVSDFSLWIEGKKTAGAVLEKNEARQIYESIVRRTRDPGLIEYMDGKVFRASIFPIPPGGTQKLEIKFGQVLQKQGGLYRYHYPLSAGKDYATAKTEKDFTLVARVHAPIPVTTVYSPTHKISSHRKSDNEVLVGTEELYATLDKDFDLYVGHSKQDIGLNIMTHDPDGEGGENGYFMLALAPRVEVASHDEIGQTFTFVMDTSGSMAGDKIEQARKTLEFCLSRLRPQDRFNVVRFSTDVEALYDNPVQASEANKSKGLAFARALVPAGGTAIGPALERVFEQKVAKEQPHQVIFVTDGIPTVGETDASRILQMVESQHGRARLFAFGVGYDVNTNLLDGMAAQARGRSDYVKPNENLETAVGSLYTRISSPVLTDIKIDFGDARIYDMYPTPIPDLFRGDQVVLFGRYREGFTSAITVTGKAGPESKKYVFGKSSGAEAGKKKRRIAASEEFSEPLEFLPKLWATRKVGFLLEQIRLNGENPELRDEVIRLAKKFGLVTPYTSFLAVDDSEFDNRRPRPEPEPRRRNDGFGDGLRGGAERPTEEDGDVTTRDEVAAAPTSKSSTGRSRWARRPKDKPAKKEAFRDFKADRGEGGVAASEATREYKEAETIAEEEAVGRQYIAGRTFEYRDGMWIQDGVDPKGKRVVEVEAYSSKYFELLRKYRELGAALKLGESVVIKLDGNVYKVVPPKK
jgi:Ca-activated chloride channel family protein